MYFVLGLIGLLSIAILFMPKKLIVNENIIIAPIVGYFAWVTHIFVGVKLDYIDFGPTKQIEYSDYALVSIVPSLLAILFLNFLNQKRYLLYVIIWTILSFLIEYILSIVGYMKHDEWKIWYSIPVYFVAYLLLYFGFTKVVKRHFD